MFTVNHFMSEKVPKRTINNVIKRAENFIRAKRKLGRKRIAKKMKKKARWRFKKPLTIAINYPSRKQQCNPISIKVVNYQMSMKFYLGRKWTFQQELNSKKKCIEQNNMIEFTSKISEFHGYWMIKLILHSIIVLLMVKAIFIRVMFLQHLQ